MGKMKLQYLWVEKYRNIENTGFNFSSEFKFSYNKYTRKLIYDNNEDYVENFFGENIDVTSIIGINGSGKTSILELIMQVLNGRSVNTNYILVFYNRETKKFEVYHTGIINNKNEFNAINIKISNSEFNYWENFKRDYFAIYYTEVFSLKNSNPFIDKKERDLSPVNMLYKYEDKNSHGSIILSYRNEVIQNQLEFLAKDKTIIQNIKINFNKDCFIQFKAYEDVIKKIQKHYEDIRKDAFEYRDIGYQGDPRRETYQNHYNKCMELEDNYDINSIFENFLPITNVTGKQAFIERITHAVFCSLILELEKLSPFLFYGGSGFDIDILDVIALMGDVLKETDRSTFSRVDKIIKFVERLKNKNLSGFSVPDNDFGLWNFHDFDNYIDFLQYFEKVTSEIPDEWNISKPFVLLINKDSDLSALKFHSFYSRINKYLDFLSFSYGLSSGEMAFLNLFSKTNKLLNLIKCRRDVKGVILMLDEADMLLHPEWQRNYINHLVNFLKESYNDIYIHLLIATHSPIILSDIPKQNIIYLSYENDITTTVDPNTEHRETFGANIFTLFNDAFFLPQGAIGKFAEDKMKELLIDIKNNNDEKNTTKIKQRIELIGDDFIKKQFIDLYEEKFSLLKSNSKDMKIKELKDENEKLRKELEQLRGTING